MSKLVESLKEQMQSVFGDSFGASSNPVKNLSEAVESALTERKRGARLMPVAKNRVTKKTSREADDRAQKNLSAFHKYADKQGEKSAQRPRPPSLADLGNRGVDQRRPAPSAPSAGGSRKIVSRGAGGGSGQHNPFKHSPNLGTGPGTPPGFRGTHGKRHHDEKKCWHCTCGNVYDKGCECIGTGATKDCPKGHDKHVRIHKDYRHAYNDMYHAWKRGEGAHTNKKKWSGPRQ